MVNLIKKVSFRVIESETNGIECPFDFRRRLPMRGSVDRTYPPRMWAQARGVRETGPRRGHQVAH